MDGDPVSSGHEDILARWERKVREGGEAQLRREAWLRSPEGQASLRGAFPAIFGPAPPASPAVTHTGQP